MTQRYNNPEYPHPPVHPGMVREAGAAQAGGSYAQTTWVNMDANNYRPPRSWSLSSEAVLGANTTIISPVFDLKPWLRNDANSTPRLNTVPIDTAAFEDLFGVGVDLTIELPYVITPNGQTQGATPDLSAQADWAGATINVATFAHATDPQRVRRVTPWTAITQTDFTGEIFNFRWEASGTRYWRVGLQVAAIANPLRVSTHLHCS